jgi:hypothetical protein
MEVTMNSAEKFNQFAQQNGATTLHLDENLVLQKELKEEIVFWGSIYGSEFVEMPDNAFTSEAAYRKWCWKTSGMMPAKRTPTEFDKYIRPKMLEATVRQSLPGTEFGAEVDDAIEEVLLFFTRNCKNVDAGAVWENGDHGVWFETLDKSRGPEIIVKIKWLMRKINDREAGGNTEGKIKRKLVCKRLVHYGRQVDDRGGTVNRLRSAYALPIAFLEGGFEACNTQTKHDGPRLAVV